MMIQANAKAERGGEKWERNQLTPGKKLREENSGLWEFVKDADATCRGNKQKSGSS